MSKKRIGLIFGGISSEHLISIRSSFFIYQTIDRNDFQVIPIYIGTRGKWYIPNQFEAKFPHPEGMTEEIFSERFIRENEIDLTSDKHLLSVLKLDAAFLGVHGGQGEDGSLQGFLEIHQIPYTGSQVMASALAMDKLRSNQLFGLAGIPVAKFVELEKGKEDVKRFVLNLPFGFPIFIKPTLGGSSVNTGPAKTPEEAITLIEKIFVTESRVLLSELISGKEVSIGVLEKKNGNVWEPFPLVPTEIRPKSEFFDYTAKYTKGGSIEITPAEVSEEMTKTLQTYALLCHKILNCRGYSRSDFIIKADTAYVLETNTLPGMTGTSLIPQQAEALGIQMKDVFTWLLLQSLGL